VQYGYLLHISVYEFDVTEQKNTMADDFDVEAMLEETYRRQVC